ncbi:hypothetical protein VSH64_20650 [Amycolatopsis rhabdoformis]|uniref:Secreted protein n=1 Tax=Amycolatopsis rhabdoformis TaxID=1448059 RepID=A0ABZ1IJT3_9PSEU|nr:hypothetical protein [Amycolatopsis rhabdoformis]WSE34464.1 hypothetical protein VSH64_20650 [Amycolatopsis rhabdoformis]
MRGTTWTRRLALAGGGVAAGLLVVTPLAVADTSAPPAPPASSTAAVAPITLSPEESQQVCGDWVPKLQKRAKNLTDRINGGAEVEGSVANLKARSADQKAKGHTAAADRLQKRADKRQSRISQLGDATNKLNAFATAHCKPAGTK